MRTTLDIDDELLKDATNAVMEEQMRQHKDLAQLTKTYVVEEALAALIRERAARRLAEMFSVDGTAAPPPRRRVKG